MVSRLEENAGILSAQETFLDEAKEIQSLI
jgi:hypothetical protein